MRKIVAENLFFPFNFLVLYIVLQQKNHENRFMYSSGSALKIDHFPFRYKLFVFVAKDQIDKS